METVPPARCSAGGRRRGRLLAPRRALGPPRPGMARRCVTRPHMGLYAVSRGVLAGRGATGHDAHRRVARVRGGDVLPFHPLHPDMAGSATGISHRARLVLVVCRGCRCGEGMGGLPARQSLLSYERGRCASDARASATSFRSSVTECTPIRAYPRRRSLFTVPRE